MNHFFLCFSFFIIFVQCPSAFASTCPTVSCANKACDRIFVDVRDQNGCAKFPCGICVDSVVESQPIQNEQKTMKRRANIDSSCMDDNSIKDLFGDTCASFYNSHPTECGESDTERFQAYDACCVCQTQKKVIQSRPTPSPTYLRFSNEIILIDWNPIGENEEKCFDSSHNEIAFEWNRKYLSFDLWVRHGTSSTQPKPCDIFGTSNENTTFFEEQIAPASAKGKTTWKWTDESVTDMFFYSKSHCLYPNHKVLHLKRCQPPAADQIQNDVHNLFSRVNQWINSSRPPEAVQKLLQQVAEPRACSLLQKMDVVEDGKFCVKELQMLFQELPVVQSLLQEIPELFELQMFFQELPVVQSLLQEIPELSTN
jgi:hypothetical protein